MPNMRYPAYGAILHIAYQSCSLVLEVNVNWSDYHRATREVVLGMLPPELLYGPNEAVQTHVGPFVEAVKRRDPVALAEVERALYAQQMLDVLQSQRRGTTDDPATFYDPTKYTGHVQDRSPGCFDDE